IGGWVQIAAFDPATSQIQLYRNGEFEPYRPESRDLPEAADSTDWYRGWRDHLGFARIVGSMRSPRPAAAHSKRMPTLQSAGGAK
ncbi:MAG: hypothetical protein AB7O26_10440, partial [Planctomycetaceae bacterium]